MFGHGIIDVVREKMWDAGAVLWKARKMPAETYFLSAHSDEANVKVRLRPCPAWSGTSDTHTALRGARRLWNDAAQRGGDCQGRLPLRNHVARLIPRACHGFGARPRWPHRSPSEHSALSNCLDAWPEVEAAG